MAYELVNRDDLPGEIRRVALEQIDRIATELKRLRDEPEPAVHEMRRRIKELRALLRMARGSIGDEAFAVENATFRDIARLISASRDRDATLQLLHKIRPELSSAAGVAAYRSLRRAVRRREATSEAVDSIVQSITSQLELGRQRVTSWIFQAGSGFGAVNGGLERTYRRGRAAFRRATESHDAIDLHEMRKHVKDQMFQLQLLKNVAPTLLKPQRELLTQLGKTLGEHHDLHTLAERIKQVPFRTRGRREKIATSLNERMQRLENEAGRLGQLAYAETPSAWIARLQRYWQTETGPALAEHLSGDKKQS
jgi:CHAD domain-containing protein